MTQIEQATVPEGKPDDLNDAQWEIARTLEGMIVVDAGPGTGKTHTVVRRCMNIIRRKDFNPKDLIMLTFTKNAAAEMKERVQRLIASEFAKGKMDKIEYERLTAVAKEVYIGTFDSFCLSVVKQYPYLITSFFGFGEELTHSADIVENDSINIAYFERFLDRFLAEKGSDFGDLAAIAAESPRQVYSLINRLMSRGILPMRRTESGRRPWFGGNDGRDLVGDVKKLREVMNGFPGLDKATADRFRDVPDAINFDLTSKTPVPSMLDIAAEDDRSGLLDLIHDIYYDFIRRCVADNHLTFGLVASFAFVILYSDSAAREHLSARYLIVDEFQDTNSNQLMISLMILKEPNLCVVGDWKQGIYGFRYVSIENITEFEARVVMLRRFLNDDTVRIGFSIPETKKLPLVENYRSSQLVIDKAYESLLIPGTQKEVLDIPALREQITMIRSMRTDIGEHTGFECIPCASREGEVEETLRSIDRYVGSEEFQVCEGDTRRSPRYSDIAVLCRSTESCRKVYEACQERGIPAFLQGEVNVMATREGKLLLAWLRYISNDKDPWGINAVLADLNYSCDEIRGMVRYDKEAKRDYVPQYLKDFRKSLRAKKRRITELIAAVFDFYGLDNDITQAITAVLASTHRNTLMTISDIVRIIESDIENDTKYDVDGLPEANAIIIQTLHKSKGLEYPIVIIPRVDTRTFPSSPDEKGLFIFSDLTGIRCRKEIISFGEERKIGESWKTAVVRKSLSPDYSEERRLLFVGISRAKQYVTMIAGPKPSQFYKYYAQAGESEPGTVPAPYRETVETELIARPPVPEFETRRRNLSVHDLMLFWGGTMRPEGEADEVCGKGKQYGTAVHKILELLARDIEVDPARLREYPEAEKGAEILDRLKAAGPERLMAEKECSLPLNDLNITVRGTIDLLAVYPDRVEVHDWKTDAETTHVEEYKLQLSVYARVLEHIYPDRRVTCVIDWLAPGREPLEFGPLGMDKITERAQAAVTVGKDRY